MRNQWLSSTAVTPVHLPLECLDSLSKYFLRFVYHCVRSSNDKHSQESLLSVANCMRRCNYFLGKSNYLCFPQMKYAYWVLLAIALHHICVYSDSETWWHDFQRYMKKKNKKKMMKWTADPLVMLVVLKNKNDAPLKAGSLFLRWMLHVWILMKCTYISWEFSVVLWSEQWPRVHG